MTRIPPLMPSRFPFSAPSSRRRFMQAAGLLGASTMLPSLARAQTATPKRLIVVFGGSGGNPRSLGMRPPGADPAWSAHDVYRAADRNTPDNLEFEFDLGPLAENDFSSTLAPLYRHRNKMIVTEGLSMLTTRNDNGDAHASAHLGCLTGAYGSYVFDSVKCHASHPSIDQLIHQHLRDGELPLHEAMAFSLPIYGGRNVASPFHEAFYAWSNDNRDSVDRVSFEANPVGVFNRIFEGVQVSGNGPTPRQLAQEDIFNRVSSQYAQLLPRLSVADRQRLDAHRGLLNDLQQSLVLPAEGCQIPSSPGSPASNNGVLFETDLDSWFDIATAAFSCDLTRVISIRDIDWAPKSLIGVDDSIDWHHEYAHHSSPSSFYNPDDAYLEAMRGTDLVDAKQASYIANLCDKLDAVPEAGGTMLDNTLVMWVREMSHGNHGHNHYHTVMLGNVDGHFNTGRYIKYAQNNDDISGRGYGSFRYVGTCYSQYLTSILQAFGLSQNAMGGITSINGIDMTGPLPRLR